jgi:hypothetical protein
MSSSWTETRFLSCLLTPEEIRARGEQLAQSIRECETLLTEERARRDEAKEAITRAESQVGSLAKIVLERAEVRAVPVECVVSIALGIVEERRTDTGELLRSREATPADKARLQGVLPLDEPAPPPPATENPEPPTP